MKRLTPLLPIALLFFSLACISLPAINLPNISFPTDTVLPPTQSAPAEPTLPVEITATPEPTLAPTLPPTATPEPTLTFTPSATPEPFYPVQAQPASYLPNFTHQEKACNWLGVGGQAFDLAGQPVQNWTVVVTGVFNNELHQWLGLTGLAPAFGVGGYEIELSSAPLEMQGAFTIQLLDAAGQPLSAPVTFDTRADCQSNLVVINFVQMQAINEVYIPIINR